MTSESVDGTTPAAMSGWRLSLRFLAILGGTNLLYYAEKKLELGVWDVPYTQLVAWAAGKVGALVLPYSIRVSGASIVAESQHVILIASGCNGLEAILPMVAGILSYPASWAQRGRGLVRYVPLLFLLNVARVVLLVDTARSHPQYLDVLHFQVTQGILIVFVLFFWAHYLRGTGQ